MRSILVLCLCAVAGVAILVHELPEGQAVAEPRVTRPQEIQSITFDGHDLPVVELRTVLRSRIGDLLDANKLAADRQALADALVADGYLDADARPAQVLFDAAGGAFVTFAITPGPQFRVRDVKVTGAAEADTGIVTLARGEVVRAQRLEQARDALATRLIARGKPGRVRVEVEPDVATSSVDIVLVAR